MIYHFLVHKSEERKGYWSQCVELSGCFTQTPNDDPTIEGLLFCIQEALDLYLNSEGNKFELVYEERKDT